MDHLISPKLEPGVHCLSLRHKGMYVTAVPYPEEANFYDKYEGTCVLVRRRRRSGFGPDGHPVNVHECTGERGCCKH